MNLNTNVVPSETKRGTFNKQGNVKNTKAWFQPWFVGFTDGDGSFTVTKSNGKWGLYFKVSQSSYNLRVLYYIKKMVGVGSVYVNKKTNESCYRLRTVNLIVSHLLPIFDEHPLLTSKYYNYFRFKQAALILNDSALSTAAKNVLLTKLMQEKMPSNYFSPAWAVVNNMVHSVEQALLVVSKPWLVGFTEAEGSFYLVKKDVNRISHGFAITQKLDLIVLQAISYILKIPVVKKKTYNAVETTVKGKIPYLIDFYTGTIKGMKAVEFRIWARSFSKDPLKYENLIFVQALMRKLRKLWNKPLES